MPQAVLQKVGAAGVPQLLLSAAPRLATTLNSNKLSIKVTSSSGTSGLLPHLTSVFSYYFIQDRVYSVLQWVQDHI